jgi:hypothetical protein
MNDLLILHNHPQYKQEAFKALFNIAKRCLLLDKPEFKYFKS